MASIARQRGIEVYEASTEVLPFDNESFDFVVMVATICFLRNPIQALQEVRRVLTPRGHIVMGMIDKDSHLGEACEAKKSEYVLSICPLLLRQAGDTRVKRVGIRNHQNVPDYF
jgi:ubiquinone/menaquinone biosynthesis C-methylase UbiE